MNKIKKVEKINKDEFIKELNNMETNFKLKYINKEITISIYYDKLESYLKSWILALENKKEKEKLFSSPDYAFTHYIAKEEYPEDYSDEVGVEIIDEHKLKVLGLTANEYIEKMSKKTNFKTFNIYGDIPIDILDASPDNVDVSAIDKKDMIADYNENPISDHEELIEKWSKNFDVEVEYLQEFMFISLSNIVYNKLKKEA